MHVNVLQFIQWKNPWIADREWNAPYIGFFHSCSPIPPEVQKRGPEGRDFPKQVPFSSTHISPYMSPAQARKKKRTRKTKYIKVTGDIFLNSYFVSLSFFGSFVFFVRKVIKTYMMELYLDGYRKGLCPV